MDPPALRQALADLEAATNDPPDREAQLRWRAHVNACKAEGVCQLTGQSLDTCSHRHAPGSSIMQWLPPGGGNYG